MFSGFEATEETVEKWQRQEDFGRHNIGESGYSYSNISEVPWEDFADGPNTVAAINWIYRMNNEHEEPEFYLGTAYVDGKTVPAYLELWGFYVESLMEDGYKFKESEIPYVLSNGGE